MLALASIAEWSLRTGVTAILAFIKSNLLLSLHAETIHLSRANHDGMGFEARRQPRSARLVGASFLVWLKAISARVTWPFGSLPKNSENTRLFITGLSAAAKSR